MLRIINQTMKTDTIASIFFFKFYGYILIVLYSGFWFLNKFFFNEPSQQEGYLRLSIVILGILLVYKDYWIHRFHKYYHFFWYFVLTYTLPFFFTLLWLRDPEDITRGVSGIAFAFVVLYFFVDKWSYIALVFLGVLAGFLVYYFTEPIIIFPSSLPHILVAYFVIIIYFVLFGKRKDKIFEEKIETLKLFGASIAHEMRGPLARISLISQNIDRYLPALLESYEFAKSNGLEVKEIDKKHLEALYKAPQKLKSTSRIAQNTIDMLLLKIKGSNKTEDKMELSIANSIEVALVEYPLTEVQRALIDWDNNNNFKFFGNEILFVHVIMNLLKNALDTIHMEGKGRIKIWMEKGDYENKLFFKDTAKGIVRKDLPFIFDKFFSKKRYGTGIGLAFCKQTMESFDGKIECESKENEYAMFILSFQKI